MMIGTLCSALATGARAFLLPAVTAATLLTAASAPPVQARPSALPGQDKSKEQAKGPKVSEDELKAAKKVEAGADAASRLQAAGEFVKKYPKSSLRPQVVGMTAAKVAETPDPAQRITLFEQLLNTFNDPTETNMIAPALVDAYLKSERIDDAFRLSETYLARNPEDVSIRSQMAIIGATQAQKGNAKFVQQSQQFGTKSIELIEADKRPAGITDQQWGEYKTRQLPQLYQAMGVIAVMTGDGAGAKTKLEKAASLNPSDPLNYALMGSMLNNDYQQMAQQYNSMPAGPQKEELLKKTQAQLDQVIDNYARTVALAAGNAQYQQLHDQIMQDLQSYYKYRHGGSTDGMQALIDKYKKPAQ